MQTNRLLDTKQNITSDTKTVHTYLITEKHIKIGKKLAKANNKSSKERWVMIDFKLRNKKDNTVRLLHRLDIPRYLLERWSWVIIWREAKLICQYPFDRVDTYHCYYQKTIIQESTIKKLLSHISPAKAQITKVNNKIEKYVKTRSANDMFFNSATDPQLVKLRSKLEQKKKKLEECKKEVKQFVGRLRKEYQHLQRARKTINNYPQPK